MSGTDHEREPVRIERLAALLRDDGVDIATMTEEQLLHYLKERRVDIEGPQRSFNEVLRKAKARQRLEHAREKRLAALDRSKTLIAGGVRSLDAIRETVRSLIEKLKQNNPGQAHVYAREFDKATPEDLKLLEEDLLLLEMDNDKDDKQDTR